MVDKPPPERQGQGINLPSVIAFGGIAVIAVVVCVGMLTDDNFRPGRIRIDDSPRPVRETDRLYGDLAWNSAGCAYQRDMAGGSFYYSPAVVPDESTPDPTDGKLLCDPTKARP